MKKILIALCAVATFASCTKNEVLSYDKEAIGFENAFVDNATRSIFDKSYTNDNLFSDFQVYGYVEGAPLFNTDNSGVKVTGSGIGDGATWTYSGTQYWIAGADYNFSAVAPATNGNWSKTAADTAETTLSFTNNGTTDLLYAQNDTYTANTDGTPNGKVGFTFRHVLSKVKFSFVNAYEATNSSIRVKDIKILNAYQNGSVVLNATTSNWTPVASSNTLTLNFGNAALTADDNNATIDQNDKGLAFTVDNTVESYKELFMIPGAGQDVTVTNGSTTTTYNAVYTVQFTVELLVNSQEITQYTHTIYTTFAPEPGKAYDLVATINATNIDPATSQEPIEFTVTTITDWDTDHNDDGVNDDETNILN